MTKFFAGAYPGDTLHIQSLDLTCKWCPAGVFRMGSPPTEAGRWEIELPHEVRHTQGFWIADCPITRLGWERLGGSFMVQMNKALLDDTTFRIDGNTCRVREFLFGDRSVRPLRNISEDTPMHFVNWFECREYCRTATGLALAKNDIPKGFVVRLPTEAEWEFACRAGTTSATYAGELELKSDGRSDILDQIAWYSGNRAYPGLDPKDREYRLLGPMPVRLKKANAWGLFDSIGNVWEWCLDCMQPYERSANQYRCVDEEYLRVPRGGSWYRLARACRAANRGSDHPKLRSNFLGFRVVVSSLHADYI